MLSDESKKNNQVSPYTAELIPSLTVISLPAGSFLLSLFETKDEGKGKPREAIKIVCSQCVSLPSLPFKVTRHNINTAREKMKLTFKSS